MASIALLLGLFVVPLVLLALGHRLRERTPRQRGAFWGGVIGHSIAVVIAITAMHYPPVLWTADARTALAFWSMLAGGVLGSVIGGLRGSRRGRASLFTTEHTEDGDCRDRERKRKRKR